MPSPKRDAQAVLRIARRLERIKQQERELENAIRLHGNRLSFAKGFLVPLRGRALVDLAEAA